MNSCKFARALIFVLGLLSANVFAYNPVFYADNYYELTSPEGLFGASSVAGGSIQEATTSSIALNPALIAGEQRYMIDMDYTAIIPILSGDSYAQAAQMGIIVPSRYGVGAAVVQGVFASGITGMNLGDSFTVRAAYAKDLTNRLYVGIGLYGGWGMYTSYAVACDLGFWYMLNKISFLPFLSNARWAMSFTGLGKSFYSPSATGGLYYGTDKISKFASPFTMRVGFAADFFDLDKFKWGFSVDASAPSFQNAVFDIGMQWLIVNMVKISTSWEANIRELIAGVPVATPSAGISVNFSLGSVAKKKDKLNDASVNAQLAVAENAGEAENAIKTEKTDKAKMNWAENEMKISSAYKNLSEKANVASMGVTLYIGQEDTSAPEIILWEGED